MISISRLYCGEATGADSLRYGRKGAEHSAGEGRAPRSASERRPVVVWNITKRCNLRCRHCYSSSTSSPCKGELSGAEGRELLKDLAAFGCPAVLLSGGEPLMRKDVFDLAAFATGLGLRAVLSTNGTLITRPISERIKEAGFTYAGVSLDGIGETNDAFRGREGAFNRATRGFRLLKSAGMRVGLRLTLTRRTYEDLERIFDFIEQENIDRACFYHLCYSGRGAEHSDQDLPHAETRKAMDIILARTRDFFARGLQKDILTVDNHVDGAYLYLKMKQEDNPRAEQVMELLRWNGGGLYSSGVGIGDVDYRGNVHPDQFWMHYTLGNVRERPFSEIWTDEKDGLLDGLRNRKAKLKGRCSQCRFLDACGGSLRVRADIFYGDPWAPDPACYLSDEEIGLTDEDGTRLKEAGEWFEIPKRLSRK
ncbi:MAG TPA: radical SAM protein [Candidatus Brocadiia bacterium]|nr:radical SAM protein [Candidatus Brocadiia bacterium]